MNELLFPPVVSYSKKGGNKRADQSLTVGVTLLYCPSVSPTVGHCVRLTVEPGLTE